MSKRKAKNLPNAGSDQPSVEDLSHAEMLRVTGLTTERLMTWYKRKLLPPEFALPLEPGKGNRRRYTSATALLLTLIRTVADAGLPVEEAVLLGHRLRALVSLRGALGDHSLEEGMELAMIVPRPDGVPRDEPLMANQFVSDRFVMRAVDSNFTEAKLRDSMREKSISNVITVDFWGVALRFRALLSAVLAARKRA